ncbi:MAG: sugar-binding transcriptional regulator [Bacillota bacterium]
MVDYFKLQQKLVPEVRQLAEERYAILRAIHSFEPIGRRSLSKRLNLSERTIRNHLEFLKDNKYVVTTSSGAKITSRGESILSELDGYIKKLRGTNYLEDKLEEILQVDVYVVPQGLNYNHKTEGLGRFSANFLSRIIDEESIIAVTGGTTLSTVAEIMSPLDYELDVTVVPARGGLGEKVEIQANTIAAKIADKLGGNYHLLHIPDNLKEETMSTLINEPFVTQILDLARNADFLIQGIGTAEVMAKRRGIAQEQIEQLAAKGAVGESFGYYFNPEGEIVYSTASVGLKLEDLSKINKVIAIAGGDDKAEAILSVVSNQYQDILITDESAARKMIEICNNN